MKHLGFVIVLLFSCSLSYAFWAGLIPVSILPSIVMINNLTFYEGETKDYWVEIIEEERPTDRQFCSQWIRLRAKFPSETNVPSIITSDNRNGRAKDHICVREYRPNPHGPAYESYSNTPDSDYMRPISGFQLAFARVRLEEAMERVHNSGCRVPNPPANWPGMEKFDK